MPDIARTISARRELRGRSGSVPNMQSAISFINKKNMLLCMIPLILMAGIFLFLLIRYWGTISVLAKVVMLAVCIIVIFGVFFALTNGIYCLTKECILAIFGIRMNVIKVRSVQRFSVTFREEENKKFFAIMKIVRQDGKTVKVDYSREFRNRRRKRLAMAVYTVPSKKIDRISKKILCLPRSIVTVINREGEIVSQETNQI